MMKRFCTVLLMLMMSLSLAVSAAAASLNNFTKQNTYVPGQFTDVDSSAWYAEYLQEAYEYGLIVGYETSYRLTWTNYSHDGYSRNYESTYITTFHWDSWRDDRVYE